MIESYHFHQSTAVKTDADNCLLSVHLPIADRRSISEKITVGVYPDGNHQEGRRFEPSFSDKIAL
jgi:hypothetical protein